MTEAKKSSSIDRSQRVLFDTVADLYDAARPRYPETLIDAVIDLACLPADGRILEVGCGPGNATLPFARRGYSLLGIELGARLAELARQHCQPFPNVRILNQSFEDWQLKECAFNLVISAEAFHWIPPEIGFPKAAAALKDGGSLCLWWLVLTDPEMPVYREIAAHYRTYAPDLDNPNANFTAAWVIDTVTCNFHRIGGFTDPVVRLFNWEEKLEAERYLQYIRTFSAHQPLAADARVALNDAIRHSIEQHGGSIVRPYCAVLFQAQVSR